MDKREIYEHLAKIYLDASSKKKKKSVKYLWLDKKFFFAGIGICIVSLAIIAYPNHNRKFSSDTALVLCLEPVKINFNFNPAKKETYDINLNKLDLTRFKELGFAVRKTDPLDIITLKIEFTSAFREKSDIYIQDIPAKWQDYRISLSQFKKIAKWSEISELSFIIEEWNAKTKKGIVYIDNVRLLL